MAKTKNNSDPQFVVRPAKDGKSWSVFCEVEIPDFPSEAGAKYWIEAASKKWLAKFGHLTASNQIRKDTTPVSRS
jgi:hypothetical protein